MHAYWMSNVFQMKKTRPCFYRRVLLSLASISPCLQQHTLIRPKKKYITLLVYFKDGIDLIVSWAIGPLLCGLVEKNEALKGHSRDCGKPIKNLNLTCSASGLSLSTRTSYLPVVCRNTACPSTTKDVCWLLRMQLSIIKYCFWRATGLLKFPRRPVMRLLIKVKIIIHLKWGYTTTTWCNHVIATNNTFGFISGQLKKLHKYTTKVQLL